MAASQALTASQARTSGIIIWVAGDTSGKIPATRATDEIGTMARTVIVFRDTMLERERLTAEQMAASQTRAQRGDAIASTIG